jgi:predicted esterase
MAFGLAVALVRSSLATRPERSEGLLSRFVGDRRVPRYSPANLLPEVDQVKLGVTLATRFVPWVGRARTIREVTMGLCREIEADPDARGLGPVTHFAALELVGANFDAGHYFAYVPEPRPGERLGAVVFLHGNGGNFQVMPWAWRAFAEQRRMAILCPTFGFGFWGDGGVEAVDRSWLDASARWPIDPGRVYLSGLSDGGVGVTRSALAHPERYRGLIYVSPTMHLDELGSPGFERGWNGRPILVFQGDRDWSVPKDTVDPAVDLLRRRGAVVDYRVYPGEDHFLFFSKSRELFAATVEWMVKAERPLVTNTKAGDR